jgi:hypothetical protein
VLALLNNAAALEPYIVPGTTMLRMDDLPVGATLTFQFAVWHGPMSRGDSAAVGTAEVEVTVSRVGVEAVVVGGNRDVSRDDEWVLDASPSRDVDFPAGGLTYAWECAMLNEAEGGAEPCALFDDSTALAESALVFQPGGPLWLDAGSYTFTVVVSRDDATATWSSSAEATVTVRVLDTSDSGLVLPLLSVQVAPRGRVSVGERLRLSGSVDNRLALSRVEWESDTGDDAGVFLTSVQQLSVAAWVPYGSRERSYMFTLSGTVQGARDNEVTSSVRVTIAVNLPPAGVDGPEGSLVVVPSSGQAYTDKFELSTLNWQDADLPLAFGFGYVSANDVEVMMTSSLRRSSVLRSVSLPSGGSGEVLTVLAVVSDRLGAMTAVRTVVTVTAPAVPWSSDDVEALVSAVRSPARYSVGDDGSAAMQSLLLYSAALRDASDAFGCEVSSCSMQGECRGGTCLCWEGFGGATCDAEVDDVPEWVPRLGLCPGSSVAMTAADGYAVPAVECSGHGMCSRHPPQCLLDDAACVSVCVCDEGYEGSDCRLPSAEWLVQARIREQVSSLAVRCCAATLACAVGACLRARWPWQ